MLMGRDVVARAQDADQQDDVDYAANEHGDEKKLDAGTEDYGPGLNSVNSGHEHGHMAQASSKYEINEDILLPENWVAVDDPLSGSTYYYNQETRETTWDKPSF